MVPTTLVAFVAILSSFTGANGAVIRRDTTYLSPQPTVANPTSSLAPSVAPTQPTTAVVTGTSAPETGTAGATSATGGNTTLPVPTQSGTPTSTPSSSPSGVTPGTPSSSPSGVPSAIPSGIPSGVPSVIPSTIPSGIPSAIPSVIPSAIPSGIPSAIPSGTSTPTPTGTVDCDGVQQWQGTLAYTAGDQVIFYGQLFTAIQWTYDNVPSTHPDQWSPEGTCTQPINITANCTGVPAWQSTVAYTTGNEVTYNGQLWSAVQWTESNAPGDASGSWKDEGACA